MTSALSPDPGGPGGRSGDGHRVPFGIETRSISCTGPRTCTRTPSRSCTESGRYSYRDLAERVRGGWPARCGRRELAKGGPRRHPPVQLAGHAGGPFRRAGWRAGSSSRSTTACPAPRSGTSCGTAARDTCCSTRGSRRVAEPLDLAGVTVIRYDDTGVSPDPYEEFLAGASPTRPASWLEHEEETISVNYTFGDHGTAQGGAVHLPRRVPERAERGDRGRPGHRLGLPVDAADVSTAKRLVLSRGRSPRSRARHVTMRAVDPGAHLGANRRRGGHALQTGPRPSS